MKSDNPDIPTMLVVDILPDGHLVCAWRDQEAAYHEWVLPACTLDMA